jgi:hypothetical protein
LQLRVAHADAAGGEIQPAAFAARHHLGVARHYTHTVFPRRARQAFDDAGELCDFEAFLNEGVEAEIERRRACDGKIVHRAVHRQRANVAAGKFQRLHDEAIGGQHDVARRQGERDGIGFNIERRISEVAREQFFNQFAHVASAVAVGEGDVGVLHQCCAASMICP